MKDNTNDINAEEQPVVALPSSFKLISTMAIAGLLSGIILSISFIVTQPIILKNKADALEAAIFNVLPNCESFETLILNDGKLEVFDTRNSNKLEVRVVYLGRDKDNTVIGIAIPGEINGFQDVIAGLIGYDPFNKKVVGLEILESKETPGLGDKIFKDKDFKENFNSLDASNEIVFVKKGQKSNPGEVEGITGATISSKAVVNLLDENISYWRKYIDVYLKEMNLD